MYSLHASICKSLTGLALSFLMSAGAQATVVLQVSGGILTGATGVVVAGNAYSVSFRDGNCASLFGGCDASSDFVFNTQAGALDASNALVTQVFFNGAAGQFDSNPALTFGCVGNAIGVCAVITPFSLLADPTRVNGAVAQNGDTEAVDGAYFVQPLISGPNSDTSGNLSQVYAVWELTPGNTVPEPGSLALACVALFALATSSRRRPS
jgi:hypothetical protein